MTTVCFICVRLTANHLVARHERRRVWLGAFSTRRNFLSTCISQRHYFSVLGHANESLHSTVFLAFLAEAALVASACRAMTGGAPKLATLVTAVVLPAIVTSTDEERHDAPEARQLVDGNARIQGSGCDRQKFGG